MRAVAVISIAFACGATPALAGSAQQPGHAKAHKHHQRAHKHRAPRPAYWGAWIGKQLNGEQPPWDMGAVSSLEGLLGKGLSLVAVGSPFASCPGATCTFFGFPAGALDNVHAYGAIPFFNWASQATSPAGDSAVMPDFQLADVIAGAYDPYIREFAEDARDWGHPFFLRFDWEMNGNWFPWSESVNGNRRGEFVTAWRHVHDIFTSVGATNATWVWCPYADVDRRFAPLGPLYPGSAYVDWTCMDGFNWASNPTNPHKWRNFKQIFVRTYRRLTKRIAPDKPIVLGEVASTGRERAKAAWIRNMFKQMRTRFRRIRALIWFDQVDRNIDWPLETSPAVARAFSAGIRNRAFKANSMATETASPIRPPH
jgi:mannan endo-1,4-beta-mannosidase